MTTNTTRTRRPRIVAPAGYRHTMTTGYYADRIAANRPRLADADWATLADAYAARVTAAMPEGVAFTRDGRVWARPGAVEALALTRVAFERIVNEAIVACYVLAD